MSGWSQILIGLGVVFVNFYIFSLFAEYITTNYFDFSVSQLAFNAENPLTPTQSRGLRISQGLISLGAFVISPMVVAQILRQRMGDFLSIDYNPVKRNWLLGIGIFLLISPLVSSLVSWNESWDVVSWFGSTGEILLDLEEKNNSTYEQMLQFEHFGDFALTFLIMAIIPAVGEEFFFRSVMLKGINKLVPNIHIAIAVVSLLFTVFHFQFLKMVPMFILATIFGYIAVFTGSIRINILLHLLNNGMVVVGYYLDSLGYEVGWLIDNDSFPWYLVLPTAIAGGYLIYLLYQNRNRSSSFILERNKV